MKKIAIVVFLGLLFALSAGVVEAKSVRVRGYYKPSTGTYVAPAYRTSPNRTKLDNYSTRGNYNPYTGKTGTKSYYGR